MFIAVDLLLAVDSSGLNNGVWILRNTEWSKKFLEDWWNSDILQGAGMQHNCSDQSTMLHTLLFDRILDPLLQTPYLAKEYDQIQGPVWHPRVRIVPQKYLQSFHKVLAHMC